MSDRTTRLAIGQVWRDEEGLEQVIVAIKDGWAWIRRKGHPHSRSVQTLTAWFDRWDLVEEPSHV